MFLTQLERASEGEITPEMKKVAAEEDIREDELRRLIAEGRVVIPSNKNHAGIRPKGVGKGLRIKINSNIGTSPLSLDLSRELRKAEVSGEAGADSLMDLSTGGDLDEIRKEIIGRWRGPLGTVPIYQAVVEAGGPAELTFEKYIDVFRRHAESGVDFATVHAGVTRDSIPLVEKRLMGVVSRGGSFLIRWMREHGEENPLHTRFDEILEIAREYDVTMSLGDGLRPGCINDATDEAQLHELKVLGELTLRCREADVQVMVEGPGHIPLGEIEKNVRLAKEYCHDAPFYVLGPLPTDIATGYDHLACAIGGALACYHGADFLCYVTPKEHVGLPDIDDVREGVVASKIAAHIADVARGLDRARGRDRAMSVARRDMKWNDMAPLVIDPKKFKRLRKEECGINPDDEYCSMCGEFCAIKTYKE